MNKRSALADAFADQLCEREASIARQHVAPEVEQKCAEILDAAAGELLLCDQFDIMAMMDIKGRAIAETYELVPARDTALSQRLIEGLRGFKTYGR